MTLQEFTNKYNEIKKGAFIKCVYEKQTNGCTKTTKTTIRFVDYYNTQVIKDKIANGELTPSNKSNPNIQTIIPHVLTYNQNTQNYLVHVYTVANGKVEITYKDSNGNEIDKATYETMVPPKKNYNKGPQVMFQIKLQDLVSLG